MKTNCKCQHAYQDATLGNGVRYVTPVNKTKKDGKVTDWRCTVCRQTTNKAFA